MDAAGLVARLWPGRGASVEPLGGGITNHNFKVSVDGEAFVLRIGGAGTELLGIDREAEHEASVLAARLGVGPAVVRFLPAERSLVTRFIEGRMVPLEEMRGPDRIRAVGTTLRHVHGGPAFPRRFDSFSVVEEYRRITEQRGGALPLAYAAARREAVELEVLLVARPQAPCHNDLLNANFIDDGERLRIVDWEYAGMGDPWFDLANFAVNHELDDGGDQRLLEAYLGRAPSEGELAHLVAMRFMSDFREAMWGVVQSAVSTLEFDFRGYAAEHFDRLERTAAGDRFREALAVLRSTG